MPLRRRGRGKHGEGRGLNCQIGTTSRRPRINEQGKDSDQANAQKWSSGFMRKPRDHRKESGRHSSVRSSPNSGSPAQPISKITYITPCEASALRSVSEHDGLATPDLLTFSATHNRSKVKSVPAQKAESQIEKRRPKRTSDLQTVPLLD